jgi:uncharacterized phage-associated protein
VNGVPRLDVRAIANLVLDVADNSGAEVSNMALNKIVYFVHCDYLLESGEPLVSAKIEAWEHGPVFREIYHEFKRWSDAPIRGRATKVDPLSGEVVRAEISIPADKAFYLREIVKRYLGFTAAQLRALSHRAGGPWAVVWGHDGRSNPGMRITDDLILKHYSPGVRQ